MTGGPLAAGCHELTGALVVSVWVGAGGGACIVAAAIAARLRAEAPFGGANHALSRQVASMLVGFVGWAGALAAPSSNHDALCHLFAS